jgi:DeoD family purine-nucleoside phosphorylase
VAPLEDIELPEGDAESTLHINPASTFHPNVLLPGDPARAMAIATGQLEQPRMFNHRRGLWGYSGLTPGGTGFTVQASGMGGPSAAIVVEELCLLGAELIVRVGTCGALTPELQLGDLVVVTHAISDDGASRALGAPEAAEADRELTGHLLAAAAMNERKLHSGPVATVDLFYDPNADARHESLVERGAIALEMEAAAVFAAAAHNNVPTACLLAVTDELHGNEIRRRLSFDEITELGDDLGAVAVEAVEASLR